MNNVEINFKLDSQKQIVLKIDAMNLTAIDGCTQCTVFLFVNKKKYELFRDLTEYALKKFKIFLEKALSNKLKLHNSIVTNIGYLWN